MRRALALTLLGVVPAMSVLPFVAATSAVAAGSPGDGFSSVTLSSVAEGASFAFGNQASSVPAETDVPYAATQVKLGQGQGTATVAWPGETGAALGSTLIVGANAPSQATILNDPAFARAQSGKGPATVTNTTVPGATMTAHATTDETTAEAAVDGAATLATTIGTASSTSASALTGVSAAVVSGTSTVRDVTIGGVVHVGAITSSAKATTNGILATASGSTSVSGLSVAGQAVSIDEHGISVVGQSLPAGAALQAVTSALAQAQITLTLSIPTKSVVKGRVEYATGSLIVSMPLGVLSLGSVQLRAAASPSDAASVSGPASDFVPPPAVSVPATTSGQPSFGTGSQPPPLAPSTGGAPQAPPAVAPPSSVQPVLTAASPLHVLTGYAPELVVAGGLLALLMAGAIAALADRLLPALGESCPLERPL
jgi:hypothetical protein